MSKKTHVKAKESNAGYASEKKNGIGIKIAVIIIAALTAFTFLMPSMALFR